MDGIITSTVNAYLQVFSSYFAQFLKWGQEFFFAGIIITIVWMCLWNAFDRNSFQESMPNFIKEFFVIALFYTIMIYANDWLNTIPASTTYMGKALAGTKVDPSSIIDQGIKITNFLIQHTNPSGVLEKLYAAVVVAIADVLIMFAFISIALDLAVTTLTIYFFIAISGFALAFSVFAFTRSIARKTLDIVVSNSMKLLSLYLVVAAGNGIFISIENDLKNTTNVFDVLGWIVAAAFLFWLISKNIPSQVARVFSEAVQETRGTDAAALSMSALRTTQFAMSATKVAADGAAGISKVAGSTAGNAKAHFSEAHSQGSSIVSSLGKAVSGVAKDAASSAYGSVSDHFKHLTNKLAGGTGMVDHKGDTNIPGFAARMYKAAQDVKSMPPKNLK